MKAINILVFLIVTAFSVSRCQIPIDHLVVFYPFDGNLVDCSGNNNTGVSQGGITWSTDRFDDPNGCVKFDGTDGSIISSDSIFISGSQARTISCWINLDTLQWGSVLGGWGNYLEKKLSFLKTFNGELYFHGIFADIRSGAVRVNQREWNHILFTYDGDTAKLFLNGSIVVQDIIDLQTDETRLQLGFDNYSAEGEYNQRLKGKLDDFRIYDRVLSETEVSYLYHESDLVAHYPFNGSADDESGNNNNGVTNSGVSWTTDRFGNPDKAANFNGVDGAIESNDTIYVSGNNPRSISCWLNIDDYYCTSSAVGWGTAIPDPNCKLSYIKVQGEDRNRLIFHGGYQDLNSVDGIIDTDKWFHAVFTYDGLTGRLYLNDVLVDSGDLNLMTKATKLSIGYDLLDPQVVCGWNTHWNGKIDDIRIYNRALSDEEIKSLYGNFRQQIISIIDIPDDQGGKVRIKWDRIYLDSTGVNPQITLYGVWRKIPPGMSVTKRIPEIMSIMNDTLGMLYDYLGTVNATQSPSYNFVAETLQDSSESGTNAETFLITAHTSDPNLYYISDAAQGYSVDNIAPSPLLVLNALWQSGPYVDISWESVQQYEDFQRYEIYRSTSKSFTPTQDLRIGSSINTAFQDAGVTDGYRYYYQVLCVDDNGNRSQSPPEAVAYGNPVNRTISMNSNWNMVSVPLDLDDFSKGASFPTAISNAFYYDGAYKLADTLMNGKGYWIKVENSEEQAMVGYLLDMVKMDVVPGWNIIGSISEPVSVYDITSEPPGMTTSDYFEFKGAYEKAIVIEPGEGYWVKVEGSGKLILSKPTAKSTPGRINIVQTGERPPEPPEMRSTEREIPADFTLGQNYPNPFNPSTSIRYGLPVDQHVTLGVYNTLGQRVALLMDQRQEAGFHEVRFDASNLPSGIYFYRLQSADHNETKKLMMMK